MEAKLIETRLEDRDGATWVTGLCSDCWARIDLRRARPGDLVVCPNGHDVRVREMRSAHSEAVPQGA